MSHVNVNCTILILGSKLHIQQKKSYQIFSVDVPRYTTGLTLDIFNERLRNVFQKLADDNIQSVAVSIDNTGTWPIGGFVPRIIRSFCPFLREKGRGIKLSLLLCSAETASLEQAKGIIQRILEEEYGKLESSRKGKMIKIFFFFFVFLFKMNKHVLA